MSLTRRSFIWGSAASVAASMTAARPVSGAETPRVITLGGDLTEIVYALGAGSLLAGRDSTSTVPPEATALPDVGYFRNVGAEGVLSLKPTVVLASAGAGPANVLKQIEDAGVTVVRMPETYSGEVLLQKVELAANALEQKEAGAALIARLRQALDDAAAEVAKMPGEPRALFLLNARDGAPMASGSGTAADAMLKLARAINIFSQYPGYKTISLEAAAAAAPEAIVMMDHTLKALGGVEGVINHPALKLTPAARSRRIIARNGEYLLGFGPRLPEAMKDLAKALREEAA